MEAMRTLTREEREKRRNFLIEYYIDRRNVFGLMLATGEQKGKTVHANNRHTKQPRPLTDKVIDEHLDGGHALSIKSREDGSIKFVTMDFDTKDDAKSDALQVVRILREEFRLADNCILTSFSGGKGYHVDLFFEEHQDGAKVYAFYLTLLDRIGRTTKQVEFRPTPTVLVKLPLGKHHGADRWCEIVDNDKLETTDTGRIYSIEKINNAKMAEIYAITDAYTFVHTENKEREKSVKKTGKIASHKSSGFAGTVTVAEAEQILETGTLLAEGTRHAATLTMTTILKENGYTEDETMGIILDIMERTFIEKRELLDDTHTLESVQAVTRNRVTYNYSRNYRTKWRKESIKLNAQDLMHTFQVKDMTLRRIIFALILHVKYFDTKADGTIEFSIKKFAEMFGTDSNNNRMIKKLRTLEDYGILTIVSSNKMLPVSQWRTVDGKKMPTSAPNRYRLNLVLFDAEGDESFKDVTIADYERIASKLLGKDAIKKEVSRAQWNRQFRPYFEG